MGCTVTASAFPTDRSGVTAHQNIALRRVAKVRTIGRPSRRSAFASRPNSFFAAHHSREPIQGTLDPRSSFQSSFAEIAIRPQIPIPNLPVSTVSPPANSSFSYAARYHFSIARRCSSQCQTMQTRYSVPDCRCRPPLSRLPRPGLAHGTFVPSSVARRLLFRVH